MEGFGGVQRLALRTTILVTAIQGSLWITDLPTGQYELRCTLHVQDMDEGLLSPRSAWPSTGSTPENSPAGTSTPPSTPVGRAN